MSKQDVLLVYMTAESQGEARHIGRVLVEERLAACVNEHAEHTAIFRWDGAVREDAETAFLAKTTRAKFKALAARVKALHSYATPAIVAVEVAKADEAFLDWVRGEVAASDRSAKAPAPER